MEKECQTVSFQNDWHVVYVLKVFHELNSDKVVSQEDLKRKTGLNVYALSDAIRRINDSVKDSIMARPEAESLGERIWRFWFAVDDLVLWKGKFTFKERRALGYTLHSAVQIVTIKNNKATIRVFKDGS